ncbi:MAG TPA: hypothetical protein VF486_03790 [Actinomycetes bacterium]
MAEEKLLERLYGLPLEGFVAARDEAARHLRQDGKAEVAEQVAELRKPTVSAWAVNQLARRHPARLGELLDRGERLRAAHRSALAGRGAAGLAAAGRAERQVVAELVRLAARELEAAGRASSQAVLDRIAGTLHAAAGDAVAARLVRGGRLARDLDPSGFGDLGPLAAEEAGHNGEPVARQGRERRQELRRVRDEARKQAAVTADRAIMAKREAERLRAAAAQAEEAATRARAAADTATKAEREASERAATSAEALAEAEARLAKV